MGLSPLLSSFINFFSSQIFWHPSRRLLSFTWMDSLFSLLLPTDGLLHRRPFSHILSLPRATNGENLPAPSSDGEAVEEAEKVVGEDEEEDRCGGGDGAAEAEDIAGEEKGEEERGGGGGGAVEGGGEALGRAIASALGGVMREFDARAEGAARSQGELALSLDCLTRESGGSIFMMDGSCNSEVAVNSQYTVIGHSEGFSSQTAPETSPMVDWKTTATSIGHDAVEVANGCLPTDTGNDQDECLQPSNVATSSELGDYSEKLKGVRPQTGPCNVTPKAILSVERTPKICNRMKDCGQTQMFGEVGGSNARAAKDDGSDYSGDGMFVTSKTKLDARNLEEAEVPMNEDHTKLVGNEIGYKPHIQDDNDGNREDNLSN